MLLTVSAGDDMDSHVWEMLLGFMHPSSAFLAILPKGMFDANTKLLSAKRSRKVWWSRHHALGLFFSSAVTRTINKLGGIMNSSK